MTDPQLAPFFTPFSIGSMTVRNRFAMAPMTRSKSPGGVPGEDVAGYYRRRAEGGVGLIITEGTTIGQDSASGDTAIPNFAADDALAGWARVAEQVHAGGAAIWPQLWHQGPLRSKTRGPHPEADTLGPSDGLNPSGRPVREMTTAEIDETIAAFAAAAGAAHRLGFDGIELHGAHGYLIDAFLWAGANRRTDRYGGSLVARTRFATEIIAACRAQVPASFPICIRLSQWKSGNYEARLAETPDELAELLEPLANAGVDVFHCSTRRYWRPEFEGSDLNLAGWVKKLTGQPVITVGSVGLANSDFKDTLASGAGGQVHDLDQLAAMFAEGQFDLIAVGRSLLQDPRWVEKVREGRFDEVAAFDAKALATLS